MAGRTRGRAKRSRFSWPRGPAVSAGIVIGATLALLFSLVAGTAVSPGSALAAIAPVKARSLARSADRALLADPSRPDLATAERDARAAIRRDPTLAASFRVLGLVASQRGDAAGALRLIRHAEHLSRRDLGTQLWLLEHQVSRGDVRSALAHFDTALRTSLGAASLLFPVLEAAIAEAPIRHALADKLAEPAPWRPRFLAHAIDNAQSVESLAALGADLRARRAPLDAMESIQLINRLVGARAFRLAAAEREIAGLPGRGQPLVDPGFDGRPGAGPFAWTFTGGQGAIAEIASGRLEISAPAEQGGELVRQLLTLHPGRYSFTLSGGGDAQSEAATPKWTLACGDSPLVLTSVSVPRTPAGVRASASFEVPAGGCTGQWLVLAVGSVSQPQGVTAWVDEIALTKN